MSFNNDVGHVSSSLVLVLQDLIRALSSDYVTGESDVSSCDGASIISSVQSGDMSSSCSVLVISVWMFDILSEKNVANFSGRLFTSGRDNLSFGDISLE